MPAQAEASDRGIHLKRSQYLNTWELYQWIPAKNMPE